MNKKSKIVTVLLLIAALCVTATLVVTGDKEELQIENTTVFTEPENLASCPTMEITEKVEEPGQTITYSESVPLPKYLQEVMQQACIDYDVPYALALAVAECESSFNLEADSGTCWGVMQINPCNYPRLRELGIEPTEYEGNIVAGVFMLGELLNKYGDTHMALMAYNCGETGANRLWKQSYFESTYSQKVMKQCTYWQQTLN